MRGERTHKILLYERLVIMMGRSFHFYIYICVCVCVCLCAYACVCVCVCMCELTSLLFSLCVYNNNIIIIIITVNGTTFNFTALIEAIENGYIHYYM